ncbi:hypothetical protein [Desulfosporosinus sp. SB140]|uniref:hypothetical protein n=1 Tax=Desulfosporosinus paludis TaxID=3115649 RepID=UPI00388F419F
MSDVLMKCGHTANAVKKTDSGDIPVCLICAGITPDAEIIVEQKPDLAGRKSRCTYFGRTFKHNGRTVTCNSEVDSKFSLAFFEHKPKSKYDEHYCGCWGWN